MSPKGKRKEPKEQRQMERGRFGGNEKRIGGKGGEAAERRIFLAPETEGIEQMR